MNPQGKKASPTAVLNRVLRYMLHYYKFHFLLVIVCILISATANVSGNSFPQSLVDDYIVPMLNSGSTDFSGLWQAIVKLIGLLALGVVASFGYNRIMVTVSRAPCAACVTICFTAWSLCPSNTLTPTPTAISCRSTPTTSTPCGSS